MRLLLFAAFALTLSACGSRSSDPSAAEADAPGPVAHDGRLEAGDRTLGSGEYVDIYDVDLAEGQFLSVTMTSSDFDPYLIVRPPEGDQYDRDDSTPGDTTQVSMVVRAEATGRYRITPTSFRPGATGAYQLRYEVSDTAPAEPAEAGDAPKTDGTALDA